MAELAAGETFLSSEKRFVPAACNLLKVNPPISCNPQFKRLERLQCQINADNRIRMTQARQHHAVETTYEPRPRRTNRRTSERRGETKRMRKIKVLRRNNIAAYRPRGAVCE